MDDMATVSLAALESALQHLQDANKRLAKLLALALIIIASLLCGLLYFITNYEIVTSDISLDAHEGAYDMRNSYGYSRSNDNLRGQLYKLMEMSSDERTRDELRKFIDRI